MLWVQISFLWLLFSHFISDGVNTIVMLRTLYTMHINVIIVYKDARRVHHTWGMDHLDGDIAGRQVHGPASMPTSGVPCHCERR